MNIMCPYNIILYYIIYLILIDINIYLHYIRFNTNLLYYIIYAYRY